MFRISMTNFHYFVDAVFSSVEEALNVGRAKGFEFAVWKWADGGGEIVASWSPIGGTRRFN